MISHWLNSGPPKHVHPEPHNVILFGRWDFVNVTKIRILTEYHRGLVWFLRPMRNVFIRNKKGKRDKHREEGHAKVELATQVLLAKAKENCEPLEARKGRKDSSLEPSGGVNILTLDLWPSQL